MKPRYFIWVILLSVFFVSCSMLQEKLQVKPPLGEYSPVDFEKLITPMFIDDYSNKYVKVNCSFYLKSRVPQGLSDTEYFAFTVKGPSGAFTPEDLDVIGPKRLADLYLSLRSGDQITVYGQAHQIVERNVAGATYRKLAIMADSIEKR